jgi:hydroxyethylthiazole kinase-like uncharacterized protein yjeF
MKVAQAHEMQEIDRLAQEDYGLSGDLLMEKAALAVCEVLERDFQPIRGRKAYIFCGKGNNGGDGLALARLLWERQVVVTVVLAYELVAYSGLAALNLRRAEKFGVPVVAWRQLDQSVIDGADLLVDALLGTGTQGVPRGILSEIIVKLNEWPKPVYALDLPSGVDVDTGQVRQMAVRAAKTITFGLPQPGLLSYPGAAYTGELVIAPIGFPAQLLTGNNLTINYLTPPETPQFLPHRAPDAHKGNGGHLLVVGGAPGLTGAVAITARAALRSGSGLITVGLGDPTVWPEKPAEVMSVAWPEALTRLAGYDVIVVGPGLGVSATSEAILTRLLAESQAPLVIDADGLNILSGQPKRLSCLGRAVVLTPHPGEMARLTGLTVTAIQADRLAVARRYAQEWGVIVVLKGARTIVGFPDGVTYLNLTGNSGMATAGMGDALAGIIGGLIAQGLTPGQAAVGGVYLHGLAGDLAVLAHGPIGFVAGDVVEQIPAAYQRLLLSTSWKNIFEI